jgi:hypothetical protein
MRYAIAALIITSLCISCVGAYAHHSFAATYLEKETMKIEGKVAQFVFRNPHSFLHVIVQDPKEGSVRHAVEWQGGGQLGAAGISASTLRSGDPVVITGNPGRNPAEHRMRMVTLRRTSDGLSWGNRPGEVVD